jgi:hypothetical protein
MKQPQDDELVDLMVITDAGELPHVKAALDAAGIPWHVRNEAVQHLFGVGVVGTGYDLVTGPPIVMVPAARREEALREIEVARSGE